jgi:hypothetical protein
VVTALDEDLLDPAAFLDVEIHGRDGLDRAVEGVILAELAVLDARRRDARRVDAQRRAAGAIEHHVGERGHYRRARRRQQEP